MKKGATTGDWLEQAQAHFAAGEFGECRKVAIQGLETNPSSPDLLRLAGRASLELGLADAVDYLSKMVELQPGDEDAWRDLGEAQLSRGRVTEATESFLRAVELRPDDVVALIDLGHCFYASARPEEAISCLRQAVEREPGNAGALRGLVEMYRAAGQLEEALATATHITRLYADDVLAMLDIAELNLDLDRLDEALSAFRHLRSIDDPEHEVYAYHGMIQAELRREQWRRALDFAIDATRVDRLGRTTDLLAFAVARVFGASDRPAPSRAAVDAALAASQAEHRRAHTEALAF